MAALAVMPMAANAATLATGQQYSLSSTQNVEGNLYVAAGTSTLGGNVLGDVVSVGGTVSLAGSVGGDALIIGGTLQVLGPVGGDVRAAGGTISINDRIGGEVIIAGGMIHLLPSAIVQGDLLIAGGQVVIDGTVQGNVRMVGGQLTINGTVNGNVSARADKPIIKGDSAIVRGVTTFTQNNKSIHVNANMPRGILWAVIGVITGMKLLAMLGLGILLMLVWRREALEIFTEVKGAFLQSVGRGIVYGILVPIAAILLLVSIIGSLGGIVLLLGYAIAMILAMALAGMFVGAWISKVVRKQAAIRLTWLSALGGIVLLSIVSLIPIIGWIVVKIVELAIFGVVTHSIQNRLSSR
jgi:hypothetical protein